jgi:exosortase/archaeosortase family protein
MTRDRPRDARSGAAARGAARAGPGTLGFVLRFVLCWAAALGLLSLVPAIEGWAIRGTVVSLVLLLRAIAAQPLVSGNIIHAGPASIEIVRDCTPLMPTLVLGAAVAAFPAPWRPKVVGVLAGAAAVWLFNVVRVMALIAVLWWMPRHFEFVHVYLWQAGTLLVVTALFMVWVRLQGRTAAR